MLSFGKGKELNANCSYERSCVQEFASFLGSFFKPRISFLSKRGDNMSEIFVMGHMVSLHIASLHFAVLSCNLEDVQPCVTCYSEISVDAEKWT